MEQSILGLSTTWMYFADTERRLDKCDFLTKMDAKFRERVKNHAQEVRESIKTLGDNPQGSIKRLGTSYTYIGQADEKFVDDSIGVPGLESAACKGIAKAVELSLVHDLPIDSHWIRGSDQVRVVVCANHRCITLLFLTPGDGPPDK